MRMKFMFTRSFSTRVEPTENVLACAAMFGIGVDEDIKITLYKDLEVNIGPGRVIYITGESGAGKSCLIRDIASKVQEHTAFALIPDVDVGELPEKPLVDQFDGWTIQRIGELLAYVGIAEAFIYLRKPMELSDGQRYRFKLAKTIYEAVEGMEEVTPVICIDEYLAFLDRETAKNVAYQTRRVASKYGICVCVATTHEDIAIDLQPNIQITMRLNMSPEAKRSIAGI